MMSAVNMSEVQNVLGQMKTGVVSGSENKADDAVLMDCEARQVLWTIIIYKDIGKLKEIERGRKCRQEEVLWKMTWCKVKSAKKS